MRNKLISLYWAIWLFFTDVREILYRQLEIWLRDKKKGREK